MSRLQIDTTPATEQLLEELVEVTGVGTKKELFNNALTLLNWAVDETRKSRTIASINEADGSYRQLQMPALTNARRYLQPEVAAVSAKTEEEVAPAAGRQHGKAA